MKKALSFICILALTVTLTFTARVSAADTDLSVSAVASNVSTIYDGDEVTLFATVRNYSGNGSGQYNVRFYADNNLVQTVNQSNEIASSGFTVVSTTLPWTPFFGAHKIKAVVTASNSNDTDSSNNSFSQRVTVLDEKNPNPTVVNRKKVVGYIPNWSYGCYQTLDWSALTHINIAFVNPTASGDLDHGFWEGDYVLKNIVDKAHENNVKVLISMGGAGGTANYVNLTQPENVDSFCQKIINFVNTNNIDGVDLDIEGDIDNAFWNNYGSFVSKLRTLCTNNQKLLTTAVGQWYAYNIQDSTFAQFDFVNIMAYDDDKSQHSSYNLASNMLSYFENRGVAKENLVLGVPFYGYTTDTGSYTAYNTIISQYPDSWQDDYAGNYAYNGKNTMAQKTLLGKTYGGIMIWELSQDVQGEKSLLKVIKDNIK